MEALHAIDATPGPLGGAAAPSAMGLVELMLKDPARLDELAREDSLQPVLVPRFLAIALVGFTIFGVAATVVLNASGVWPSWVPRATWPGPSAANLILAYDLGLIAASGVCLPSFYFYGLLAGVKLTMLQAVAHLVKTKATTAVMLVGILPLYVALALGIIVFGGAAEWLNLTIAVGLALPFVAGLWGIRSLYLGFMRLADTLPACDRTRRTRFLRMLTLSWAGCYTAVSPLMIYTLWRHFAGA